MSAWWEVYRRFDDEALAALANRGLVRRAHRELAAGAPEVVEDASGATVTVSAARVHLDGRGPAAATCGCSSTGVCLHIVVACLWARARGESETGTDAGSGADVGAAEGQGATAGTDAGSGDVAAEGRTGAPGAAVAPEDPLADLLSRDPKDIMRAAGRAAVRRVATTLPRALASADPAAACDVTVVGPRLAITWRGGPVVHHLAGADPADAIVDGDPGAAAGAALRLEAVVRVFARAGRSWPWPAAEASGLDSRQRAAVDEAQAAIVGLVEAGLAHLGGQAGESMRSVAVGARLAGLPLLHRLLLTAAGRLDQLADRAETVRERDAFGVLAEAWALCQALSVAGPDALGSLVGTLRREATTSRAEHEAPRFLPLGARRWRAASGARGVTVTVWDRAARQARTATAARPAGQDPSFRPGWDSPTMWGVSVSRLCSGPFDLDPVPEHDDGTLGAGAGVRFVSGGGGFDVSELMEIARRLDAFAGGRDAVGFGRVRRPIALIPVRETGEVGIDELRQAVTWSVVDASGGQLTLAVPVARLDDREEDGLLALLVEHRRVVAVTVEHADGFLVPVGLFRVAQGGAVELVVPRLTPGTRRFRTLSGRLAALRRAAAQRPAAGSRSRGPVDRVCDPVLGVVESMAATGRWRLTPAQAATVRSAANLAADLGLATVSAAVAALADRADPETVLRAQFVLDRARALAG